MQPEQPKLVTPVSDQPAQSEGSIFPYGLVLTGLSVLFGGSGCSSKDEPAPRDLSGLVRDNGSGAVLDVRLAGRGLDGQIHEFVIPASCYEQYRSMCPDRGRRTYDAAHHAQFVTSDDVMIRYIATTLTQGDFTPEKKAQHLLDWVRSTVAYDKIEFESKKEFFRFPIETLAERRGDCDDTALLYAALCRSIGIDTVLISFPGHIGVGVAGDFYGNGWETRGKRFYFAETTNSGERIGRIAFQYEYGHGEEARTADNKVYFTKVMARIIDVEGMTSDWKLSECRLRPER